MKSDSRLYSNVFSDWQVKDIIFWSVYGRIQANFVLIFL